MSINTIFGLEAKKTAKELYGAIEKVKVQQSDKPAPRICTLQAGRGRLSRHL
jgi:hypothetical protein